MAKSGKDLLVQVDPASLLAFRREYTRVAMEFPQLTGRATRRLGNAIMRSMRTALQRGQSNSATVKFPGGWPALNPLYVYMRGLKSRRTFGGKLAGKTGERKGKDATGGLGSPIGYYYDEQGMSLAVGMFRSVPGMRTARKRKSEAVTSPSAVASFERFQDGGTRPALDALARRAVYQQIIAYGGGPTEIAMARREMHKGWVTPARKFIEPMASANMANWLRYLISQLHDIFRNSARKRKAVS